MAQVMRPSESCQRSSVSGAAQMSQAGRLLKRAADQGPHSHPHLQSAPRSALRRSGRRVYAVHRLDRCSLAALCMGSPQPGSEVSIASTERTPADAYRRASEDGAAAHHSWGSSARTAGRRWSLRPGCPMLITPDFPYNARLPDDEEGHRSQNRHRDSKPSHTQDQPHQKPHQVSQVWGGNKDHRRGSESHAGGEIREGVAAQQ